MEEEFAERVNSKCDGNEDWCGLKRKFLNVAREVYGYIKGKPRYFETWWWNKDVDVAECKTRELFRIWKQSWNEKDREKNCEAKKDPERVLYIAMDWKGMEAVEKVDYFFIAVNCLELLNKELGRREILLGLVVSKMKLGQ